MCGDRRRVRGASLIEVIVFIVIVSVAAGAVLGSLQWSVRASPDPMIRKQLLAIAESMLEEVLLQPHTWCDPTDVNLATATSDRDCASLPEALGPEPDEDRYGTRMPFNNVNDYHDFRMAGIRNVRNEAVPGLEAYAVVVQVSDARLAAASGDSAEALRVLVTVTGPASSELVLEGYRTRHAPNAAN
ncbi:MAG: prepilin-type N-terminal cleavage/methylation domain-containing protein [Burkholderiales bacterium]|jgi:MSHA pilin protein MshD|nr:prepilin-type N-terminal cleavage/methylation domain-containing protein [Burkholderiales bacterium]